MITNKKIWAIVLSILMLIATIIPSPYTNAAGEFTITGNSVNVKAGKQVSVNVSLVNNPGISAINLYYTYDTNYLTLKNVENKVSKFTMTNDVTTVWDAASNYTEDGILATLTFEVARETPSGAYVVGINFLSASNDSFQSVPAQTTSATITVEALPVAATGVTLNKNSISLVTGDMETLIATVTPDNATNKAVSWKSSDTTVATVDSNGKVTAMKKGMATITVTTEDGHFVATCEVSVACSHANSTVHPAVESTCLIQGNNTYTTCNDCGVVISGSDAKLPFDPHKGGVATCKDKAVCIVCNKAYGEYAGHQLTNHPYNEANHSKAGNIEYWTCDICNKYFNDAAGDNEIRQEDTVINKIAHSFNTEWSNNGIHHWKECICGEKEELAEHQFDNECDTTCNVGCGYTRTITHQWKSVYSTDDNKHWYECEICAEKKDEGNHSGGIATCKDKAMCEICNKAYGEFASHDMIEKEDASYLKLEANCVEKAVYYKSCSICGTASTETFKIGELDSTKHTGETDVRDDVKETCTVDGYSGDVYCKDCGAKIKEGEVIPAGHSYGTTYQTDSVNHWKECGCGDTVEKATHTFTEWTVTKEASATEKGSKERVCSVCKYNEVEELPVKETNSPQTGDYRMVYLWIALIVVSFVSVAGTIYKRKKV